MAETIGTLVDKLSITNIKLWFVQDRVHRAAESHQDLDADTVSKLVSLNKQRTDLMVELDLLLAKAVESGTAAVNPQVKIY